MPKFINENTLVIVSSFSGNTEETLEALKVAQEAIS
jgi:fructoselysine-6-P-deglycase FrlB-like protein